MAAKTLNVTQNAESLKTLFNDVEEILYSGKEITKASLSATTGIDLQELPVTEDGISFNTGEAEVNDVKLTTGKIWATKVTKGDADISFQLPAIAGSVTDMFLNKGTSEVVDGVSFAGKISSLNDAQYTASAYTLTPKKVVGALVMPSADRETVIVLPKVEMYGSLNLGDGDNPAYFDVKVTPLANSDGDEIYVLTKKVANA